MAGLLSDSWKVGDTIPEVGDIPVGGLAIDKTGKRAYSSDGSDVFPLGAATHDELSGIGPDDHHAKVHALYGDDHSDVNTTIPLTESDILAYGADSFVPSRRTRSVGGYVQGAEYYKGDELSNGSDLSECLLDGTTSNPFVSPVGDTGYAYNGAGMTLEDNLASQVIFGNRYVNNLDNMYITGYRVYTEAGEKYKVTSVFDPLGVAYVKEQVTFIATIDGWTDFTIDPVVIRMGEVLDIVVTELEPDPTPTVTTASYAYATPQNPALPQAGAIQHPRGQPDLMSISYEDAVGGDRTALIQSLSIGDIIDSGNIAWTVQSNTDQGSYANVTVTPATTDTAGTKDFDFHTVAPTPIPTPVDNGYWTAEGVDTQGIIAIDQPYTNATLNGNAYGVDITYQFAYVPEPIEWRLKIIAGQAGSGGGSEFIPTTFLGAGTTGYVPDPVTESGYFLRDDGSFVRIEYDDSDVLKDDDTNQPVTPTNKVATMDDISAAIAPGKNLFINGSFNMWQRGTNFTGTGYCADRWVDEFGAGGGDVTQIVLNTSTLKSKYALNFVSNSGTSSTFRLLEQRIENPKKFGDSTYTFSWATSLVSAVPEFRITTSIRYGDGSREELTSDVIVPEDLWERSSVTIDVPNLDAYDLTDPDTSFSVNVETTTASYFELLIGEMQFEFGDIYTDYEYVTEIEDALRCYRYYNRGQALGGGYGAIGATSGNASMQGALFPFPVPMRVIPSISIITEPTYVACTHGGFSVNETGFVHTVTASGTRIRAHAGVYAAQAEFL